MNYSCEMMNFETLADRLTWARKRRGLSQQELADRSDVAQSTIASLEAGTRFSARKIASIANALDVDVSWLAENKGQPPAGEAGVTPKAAKASIVTQRPDHMQWVTDDEAQLLSLYRTAADERGRELIRLAADSVPKVASVGRGEPKH